MLSYLAESLATQEPALRLLFSLLIGYPLALFHRKFLYGTSPNLQHMYFISTGLFLGYFNYGTDIVHTFLCVVLMYALQNLIRNKRLIVFISLIVYMTYLITAYILTSTKEYDITWSMPQCVLTLRLIGLAFDVYDGTKDKEKLSNDQKKTALDKSPTFLEIAGHSYFFGGFMVGPQFPMKMYLTFVHGKLYPKDFKASPTCEYAAFYNLFRGIVVLSIYQIGSLIIPDAYLLSDAFYKFGFFSKVVIIGLWGKIYLYKYISCWLISEGSCILTGMTYTGEDSDGKTVWNGCNNINLWQHETTTTFDRNIKAFNINTNMWLAQYVYKRLKFLGNKYLSQIFALFFLAAWHGLHSGYYICFFNEFIIMKFERDIATLIMKSDLLSSFFKNEKINIITSIFLKFYLICMFGYCLIPFGLLSVDRWFPVYTSVYFYGHVLFIGWPLVYALYSIVKKKFFRSYTKVKKED